MAPSGSSPGSPPESAALAAGVERAHSVIADGHKWLNVPYDCGFSFVREPARLASAFTLAAAYLPADDQPNFGYLGPGELAAGPDRWPCGRA